MHERRNGDRRRDGVHARNFMQHHGIVLVTIITHTVVVRGVSARANRARGDERDGNYRTRAKRARSRAHARRTRRHAMTTRVTLGYAIRRRTARRRNVRDQPTADTNNVG